MCINSIIQPFKPYTEITYKVYFHNDNTPCYVENYENEKTAQFIFDLRKEEYADVKLIKVTNTYEVVK